MEICTSQTIDKGKGSCYGKRGERWYNMVDNPQFDNSHPIHFSGFHGTIA